MAIILKQTWITIFLLLTLHHLANSQHPACGKDFRVDFILGPNFGANDVYTRWNETYAAVITLLSTRNKESYVVPFNVKEGERIDVKKTFHPFGKRLIFNPSCRVIRFQDALPGLKEYAAPHLPPLTIFWDAGHVGDASHVPDFVYVRGKSILKPTIDVFKRSEILSINSTEQGANIPFKTIGIKHGLSEAFSFFGPYDFTSELYYLTKNESIANKTFYHVKEVVTHQEISRFPSGTLPISSTTLLTNTSTRANLMHIVITNRTEYRVIPSPYLKFILSTKSGVTNKTAGPPRPVSDILRCDPRWLTEWLIVAIVVTCVIVVLFVPWLLYKFVFSRRQNCCQQPAPDSSIHVNANSVKQDQNLDNDFNINFFSTVD